MTIADPLSPETSLVPIERRMPDIGMRYLYLEPAGWAGGPTVVVVHGISRNYREHASAFASACIAADAALIVPRFSNSGYRGYQRLRRGKRGLRSDEALLRVLDELQTTTGHEHQRDLRFFGFSGGAQFAHRFALVQPTLVKRLALASAGFYTFPQQGLKFPYGVDASARIKTLHPQGFLIPTRVFVGDQDVERDEDLRVGSTVDRQQGRNRLERARRFVLAARALASNARQPATASLELLPGCNHDFKVCAEHGSLVNRSIQFLIPDASE